jgi:hypothetical protein
VRLRGGYAGSVEIQCSLRGGDPTLCGSGVDLCPGTARGQRGLQNGEAALQIYRAGIWQAGCSFIRLWCGEEFHDLSV